MERLENGGTTWKGARVDRNSNNSNLIRGYRGSNINGGKKVSTSLGDERDRGRMTKQMLEEDLRSLQEERLARQQEELSAELNRQRKAPAKRKSCKEIEQIQKELQALRSKSSSSTNNIRENSTEKSDNVPINNNGFKFLDKKNILEWSIKDSLEWLQWLNLSQYSSQFAENQINGPILLEISNEDLDYMNINILAHRKILLKGISDLNLQMKHLQNKNLTKVPIGMNQEKKKDGKEIKIGEFKSANKDDRTDNQAENISLLEQEEKKLFQEAVTEWRSMKGKKIKIVREYKGEGGEEDSPQDDPFEVGKNTVQKKKEYEEALLKEQEENLKIKSSFSLMNDLIPMEEKQGECNDLLLKGPDMMYEKHQEEKSEKSWHNPFYTGTKENISEILDSIDQKVKVDKLNKEGNINVNIEDTEAHYAKIEAEEHALFEDAVLQWRKVCSRSENRNSKIKIVHANKDDGVHMNNSSKTDGKNSSSVLLAQNISHQLDVELQQKKEQYESLKKKLMTKEQEQYRQEESKLEGKEGEIFSETEETKGLYHAESKEESNDKKNYGYFTVPEKSDVVDAMRQNKDEISGVTKVRILDEETNPAGSRGESKGEEKDIDFSRTSSSNIATGVTYSVTMVEDPDTGSVDNERKDDAAEVLQTPRIAFLD